MLEAFTPSTSFFPGDTVRFFIGDFLSEGSWPGATVSISVDVEIIRRPNTPMLQAPFPIAGPVNMQKTPQDAYVKGCHTWPQIFCFQIPSNWPSGVYTAIFTRRGLTSAPTEADVAQVPFIVKGPKSLNSSSQKPLLVVFPMATHLAYNSWPGLDHGGNSLYGGYTSTGGLVTAATSVHLHRPGLLSRIPGDYDDFLSWASTSSFHDQVEFADSFDIHNNSFEELENGQPVRRSGYLDRYRAIVFVWHHEYWSKEMRDHLEAYIANGGNVCFLSGNTCWWQVRFRNAFLSESNPAPLAEGALAGPVMDCFRGVTEQNSSVPRDPLAGTARDTVRWIELNPARPESTMVGLSSLNAVLWGGDRYDDKPPSPFHVNFPAHWFYAGTGLGNNATYGTFYYDGQTVQRTVVGYETDAIDSSTPPNFIHLAFTGNLLASAPGGSDFNCGRPQDSWLPIDPYDRCRPAAGGDAGLYRRNGTVVALGSIDWKAALGYSPASGGPLEPSVAQITSNLFSRLTLASAAARLMPSSPRGEITNRGFERWSSSGPIGWDVAGAGTCTSAPKAPANQCAKIDAGAGFTFISQFGLQLDSRKVYRAGCWVRSAVPGAQIKIQSNNILPGNIGGLDFVTSNAYSGTGEWRYLCGVGQPDPAEGTSFLGRVKIEVPSQVAYCDDVSVECLNGIDGNWDKGVPVTNAGFEAGFSSGAPLSWYREGAGTCLQESPGPSGGLASLRVDASAGHTWVSQILPLLERRTFYRIGCWAKTSTPHGAALKLQSTKILLGNVGGVDYLPPDPNSSETPHRHSGSGQWEYLWTYGYIVDDESAPSGLREGVLPQCRIKLEVPAGAVADFDDVSIDIIGSCDQNGNLL